MKVILNGETYETESETLQDLFEETHPGTSADGKAIAVNDEVIPSEDWSNYHLSAEDRIEVIQAVQGG